MPLTDPVPSSSFDVLERNIQDTDKFVNQENGTFTNRVGKEIKPIPVIEAEANAAVISLGWHQVGLFADGFTYLLQNDIAKDVSGDWYRWNGSLPKVVTAGTLPSSDVNFVKIDYKSHLQLTDTDSPNSHPASAISNDFGVSSEDFMNNILTAESFGTLRNTATLQAAVDAAISSGKKVLTVNDNWSVGEITNKGEVSFVGNGSITGLYRKKVARYTDSRSVGFNDVVPEIHLKRFLSKQNPVVVIVGDSLATEEADISTSNMLWSRLKAKITQSFPDKNITFFNRAIGGETYFTAVGLPSSFPTWYTNTGAGWPVYVGNVNPDLVIFSFGMNDTYAVQSSTLRSYQDLLDNVGVFPSGRPDVIYCTNLTPSLDSPVSGGVFSTEDGQGGRDYVAGITRSYARSVGAGLLDFHRNCTIIKDGYDPTDTYLEHIGNVIPVGGAVNAQTKCTDFKWELTLTLAVSDNVAVKLGLEERDIDIAGRGAFTVISNVSGNLNVDLYTTPTHIQAGIVTEAAVPDGSFVLTVEKKQQSIYVSINDSLVVEYHKFVCAGQDFTPLAGDAIYTSGQITAATFWAGRYKSCQQSINNNEMWGTPSVTTETRQPLGGNGVNHPTTKGASAVYQPVIDCTTFGSSIIEIDDDVVTFTNGWTQLAGFSETKTFKQDKMVTVSFHVVPPSAGATGTGFTVKQKYRPPSGISVFFTVNQSSSSTLGQLNPDGTVQFIGPVSDYAWGSFSFESGW